MMPTPGHSLVGFMDQARAMQHLRNACVPVDESDAALTAEWQSAQAKVGAPVTNAGNPDIQPIPAAGQNHIQQLLISPAWSYLFQGPWQGATFQYIEIDPLLAFQFTVDTKRSQHHCASLTHPPTLDELLNICLPLNAPSENFQVVQGTQSVLLKARSLNVQTLAQGMINAQFMGVQFGVSLPFTHVVRHNGKCYLHNGFHRAYGARIAGATHIPCIFREVPSHAEIGIKSDGSTFDANLLESAHPPTLSHFNNGFAHSVSIRAVSRVLHVSWAEYAVPEE